MSTILKALRRLEEDSSIDATHSTPSSGHPDALPATSPHATDELRNRILAEESAAKTVGTDVLDPSPSKKRIRIVTALAATILVGALILGLALRPGSPTLDEAAETLAVTPTTQSPSALSPPSSPPSRSEPRQRAKSPSPSPSPSRYPSALRRPVNGPSPVASRPASAPSSLAPQASGSPPIPLAVPVKQGSSASGRSEGPATAGTSTSVAAIPIIQPGDSRAPPIASAAPPLPSTARSVSSSPDARPARLSKRLTSKAKTPTQDEEQSLAAAAVSSAALSTKPLTKPQTKPPVSAAADPPMKATRKATHEVQSKPRTESTNEPAAAAVEEHKGRAIPDVAVLRTAWHPNPDRRSAKIRLLDTKQTLNLKEGDAVGGLVIQEISPSAVIFRSGEIELRLRVGQPGPGS